MKDDATTSDTASGRRKWAPYASWGLTIAWMAVIFAFSAQPFSANTTEQYLGGFNVPIRKLAHMTEYAILFWLWHWSLACTFSLGRRTAPLALAAAVLYAISDEYHQSFVPGRSATVGDALVDTAGALCAWAFLALIGLVRSGHNPKTEL